MKPVIRVLAVTTVLALLAGCSHSGQQSASASGSRQNSSAATSSDGKTDLPQPDWNTPDSDYVKVNNINQAMALYGAFAKDGPKYGPMTQAVSVDYNQTTDTFKKHAIVESMKPQFDAEIAQAKSHRYISWDDDNDAFGHYDFNTESFKYGSGINGFGKGFNSNGLFAEVDASNSGAFYTFHVSDTAVAKQIELLVGGQDSNPLHVRFFGFIQGTSYHGGSPGNIAAEPEYPTMALNVVITKAQILGSGRNVLFTQQAKH